MKMSTAGQDEDAEYHDMRNAKANDANDGKVKIGHKRAERIEVKKRRRRRSEMSSITARPRVYKAIHAYVNENANANASVPEPNQALMQMP
jgi:hypothetical protein